MRGTVPAILALALVGFASNASAQEILIRSDVPLPVRHDQQTDPFACGGNDMIAMCNRFATGDWKVRSTAWCGDPTGCESWARLVVAGIFHGGYLYGTADTQQDLRFARAEPSLIVKLEGDPASTLYALQVGFLGGSSYILLTASGNDIIKRVSILEPHCLKLPHVEHRDVRQPLQEPMMFSTAYCAVNSMEALVAIARDALNRAPAGSMTWVAEAPADP